MAKGIKGTRTNLCSRCKIIKETENKRYCNKCSANYMKKWRKKTKEINIKINLNLCKCGNKRESDKKRYCNKCSAAYNREWRKKHPLNEKQKFKDNVRRKTNMRIKRGLLIPYPCEKCGEKKVEAHHDDYNEPYNIRWLCFKCHREHHKNNS